MNKERFIKRLSSFILVFVMMFSFVGFNGNVFAEETKVEVKQSTVEFKISGLEEKAILDLKNVEFKEKENALDFVKRVMDENKVEYVDAGGYLSSINGLAAFDKGQYSGWMTKVNGELPTVGLGDIEIKKDDKIELFYIQNFNSLYNVGKGKVVVKGLEEKAILETEFVEYKKDETALDFVKKNLDDKKIKYIEKDGYISSINELAAFSKGKNSGWLVKVNDVLPEVGLKDIKVEDGIVVEIFFVEDFNTFFKPEVEEKEFAFEDLEKFPWAKEAIENLLNEKVIVATEDNKFNPENDITRAEFSTFLSRLLKLEEVGENKFTDIKETDVFYKEVLALSNKGYIDGREDGTFDPNGKITRQEIVKIIGQILEENKLKSENEELLKAFKDSAEIAEWAKEGAISSIEAEIIKGTNGNFMPTKNASRAEAATMLNRLNLKINSK